ncbi:AraC family transcriptional regulator [Amphibacillus cookii]|uniref:AraC family transcriptional regulator n=1 Tax=Amphibacillus cookii TaxID=767787 RepID=UPI00195D3709|nr:AraC family transcriptional regulator [Amphibacillus cookii]MBM7541672.1 AraC-like DNA-binding protein [Amphibacillus cookii]
MTVYTSGLVQIPAGFWTGLRRLGIAPHDVLRKAQLPISIVSDSNVTTSHYFAIWQAYAELISDTAKGIIKLVTSFETDHFPPTVLATYHARDYRDALKRMAKYKQLCPPESLHITEEGELCAIEIKTLHSEEPGLSLLTGITLAFLLELGRRGTGQPLTAKYVEFSTHSIGDLKILEDYFGCPIQIGTSCNKLTIHRASLDLPFVSYNTELLEILTPILEQSLNGQQRSPSMTETVKWILKRSLAGGRPDIRTIASELGVSDRTLQRRLTEEGTSFKHLLGNVRHEQAREYLGDPSLNIKEIAFLIGYEDQNSFFRAFRIWEGVTPLKWRNEHLSPNLIN